MFIVKRLSQMLCCHKCFVRANLYTFCCISIYTEFHTKVGVFDLTNYNSSKHLNSIVTSLSQNLWQCRSENAYKICKWFLCTDRRISRFFTKLHICQLSGIDNLEVETFLIFYAFIVNWMFKHLTKSWDLSKFTSMLTYFSYIVHLFGVV